MYKRTQKFFFVASVFSTREKLCASVSVVSTSLDGFFYVTRALLPKMLQRKHGGSIVNMASLSGLKGTQGQTNYSAAKAALIGATKALAIETAARSVRVNAVACGATILAEVTGYGFSSNGGGISQPYDKAASRRTQLSQLANAYAAEVERLLELYPLQWFNYSGLSEN